MAKAIALYSGGLDSTLAILTVLRQGVEVLALTFLTKIGCGVSERSAAHEKVLATAKRFGFTVQFIDLSERFLAVVRNPTYGYGKNMNPCVDCKILMLKEAKQTMQATGADFIVTGEVLYQRPMSQRRDTFPMIERDAGLQGLIIRPLCAKRLKPTIPEEQGLLKRELLHSFAGRSRKPQIALAKEYGLTDYPQPAGGCLLTDPIYSYRLKELLRHIPEPSTRDLSLLRLGRHFRAAEDCKVIVGRDQQENDEILALAAPGEVILWVEGYGSPLALIPGPATDETVSLAAALCARYSDAKQLPVAEVTVKRSDCPSIVNVTPAAEEIIQRLRIDPH